MIAPCSSLSGSSPTRCRCRWCTRPADNAARTRPGSRRRWSTRRRSRCGTSTDRHPRPHNPAGIHRSACTIHSRAQRSRRTPARSADTFRCSNRRATTCGTPPFRESAGSTGWSSCTKSPSANRSRCTSVSRCTARATGTRCTSRLQFHTRSSRCRSRTDPLSSNHSDTSSRRTRATRLPFPAPTPSRSGSSPRR